MTPPDSMGGMWEALRLDRGTVAARARFYRAYAELEEAPLDVRDVVELLRDGPIEGPGPRVVNLMGPEAHVVGERLRDVYPSGVREPWVRVAEAADALRNAAIAELLLDTRTGRATLLEAGYRYRQLGLPFGDFLVVAAVGDRERSNAAARQLAAVLSDRQIRRAGLLGPAALAAPAQQLYLLFTAAPEAADLWPQLAEAPQAHRTLAVGVTSQAFSAWWRLGSLLTRLDSRAEKVRRDVARIIAELAEAHSRQLQLAAADDYHWSTGRAQTDLIDLDLAGAVAISVRIMWRQEIPPWSLETDFPALSPMARISLEIGLQLGADDPPSDDYFAIGPHDPPPVPLDDVVRRAGRRDTDYE